MGFLKIIEEAFLANDQAVRGWTLIQLIMVSSRLPHLYRL